MQYGTTFHIFNAYEQHRLKYTIDIISKLLKGAIKNQARNMIKQVMIPFG